MPDTIVNVRPSEVRFSPDGTRLYAADADGFVRVYNGATGALITSWDVGDDLGGMDISPDGDFLIVVERQATPVGAPPDTVTPATVYKVDTATGSFTSFTFPATGLDGTFFDAVVLSDGTALLSQNFNGSGSTALRVLNLDTATFTTGPMVQQSSTLTRAPDAQTVLIGEPNSSNGQLDIYETGSGIVDSTTANGYNFGIQAYDGAHVAQYIYNEGIRIYDAELDFVVLLPDWAYGTVSDLAFSGDGRWLYVLDNVTNEIARVSTATWLVDSTIPVDADVGGWSGSFSAGSRLLFNPLEKTFSVVTDGGLALVDNPYTIVGTPAADTLTGTAEADSIHGLGHATGRDEMSGLGGDDAYYVTAGDHILEAAGSGNDLVYTSQSFSLNSGAEVETLAALAPTSTSTISIGGNEFAQTIYGNAGSNSLSGAGGDDTLIGLSGDDGFDGGAGNDTMIGGAGNDHYYVNAAGDIVEEAAGGGNDTVRTFVSYVLAAGSEVETLLPTSMALTIAFDLTGNEFSQTLYGNAGPNVLNGMGGNDTMLGLGGNDVFYVDSAGDAVHDGAGLGNDTVYASVSFTLAPGAEIETLSAASVGAITAINLTGNAGAQAISGNNGDNVLSGLGGNDVLAGHGGNDTLVGAAGNDTLTGGEGNDILDGGINDDVMTGGLGNDTYYVDSAGDTVNELAGQGTDTMAVAFSFALAAGSPIEYLATIDAAATTAINLTGNAQGNILTGNAGANVLNGAAGNDLLIGGAGNDIFYVDGAGDVVSETAGAGNDILYASASYALAAGSGVEALSTSALGATTAINLIGNELVQVIYGNAGVNSLNGGGGNDTLVGFGGNDVLNGSTGNDVMNGGAGNDEYHVDAVGDVVQEAAGQGSDIVYTSVSYALTGGAEVETLSTTALGATTALNLTGNAFAQVIYGNAGANVLNGGGGNDTLVGLGGNDVYHVDGASDVVSEGAGAGNDIVYASASYALAAGVHVETLSTSAMGGTTAINLIGNELAQTIYGNAGANSLGGGGGNDTLVGLGGNDVLNGGGGNDTLHGGTGNDEYHVDAAGDVVQEAAGGGSDIVYASVSYALAAGAEIETLSTHALGAVAAIDLTGNATGQVVYGNAGVNVLDGGGGNDTLIGLGGADVFAFTTALGAGNVDTISDYSAADDTIHLENAVFTGLAAGALAPGAFNTGTAATEADDRIIYNSATGALLFDADGSGGGAAAQFATLATGLALASTDFVVI